MQLWAKKKISPLRPLRLRPSRSASTTTAWWASILFARWVCAVIDVDCGDLCLEREGSASWFELAAGSRGGNLVVAVEVRRLEES